MCQWVPVRADGKVGEVRLEVGTAAVLPGWPVAHNPSLRQLSSQMYEGSAEYRGGEEGGSTFGWFRKPDSGMLLEIEGAHALTYPLREADYGCRLVFA